MGGERFAENKGEKYSVAQIYEHLFPDNKFADLPLVSGRGKFDVFVKTYFGADLLRKIRLAKGVANGQGHAERENITSLDQLTAGCYLKDFTLSRRPQVLIYPGDSVWEFVDRSKGEKFGGIAVRPTVWRGFLTGPIPVPIEGNPRMSKPEIIQGVMDKNNRPVALIHIVEWTGTRAERRARERAFGPWAHPEPRAI
jgi:hypothetical protein